MRRALLVLALLLAALGAWLAIDALVHGGLARYRLIGVVAGAVLAAPLVTVPLWRRPGVRKVAFALVPLLAVVALLEVVFRMAGLGESAIPVREVDAQLGHTLRPGRGGVDANGLRNDAVPARADVLCIGDSMTYGFGVAAPDCLPQRVGARTGRSVYNAGVGGYGPIQYRELARRLLPALQPRDVVVGVYLGNDLIDAVAFAHLPGAADLRRPGYAYPAPQPLDAGQRPPNLTMQLLDGALEHSQLIGFCGTVLKDRLRGAGGLYDAEPDAPQWRAGPAATAFATALRLRPDDVQAAHVQEALRLTAACLRDLAAGCAAHDARGWLLLIPTKEAVYEPWLAARGARVPALDGIAAAEAAVRAAIAAAGADAGLRVLDAAPTLREGLDAGETLWPRGTDGHPVAAGYDRMAALVAEALTAAGR